MEEHPVLFRMAWFDATINHEEVAAFLGNDVRSWEGHVIGISWPGWLDEIMEVTRGHSDTMFMLTEIGDNPYLHLISNGEETVHRMTISTGKHSMKSLQRRENAKD